MNSRKLKFRAWDKQNEKMLYDLINLEIIHEDSITDEYHTMQFTGLTDKNGKEIYDGDLMFHPEFATDRGKKVALKVEFKGGCYRLNGWTCINTNFSKGEIIGNIYENPKLLSS